ncbi:MAG: methyltransferase domain-containing protein [Candidatus Omnitrophica bacterium]|nr:methyltransferase domain-containing protein [Candidatus Omnitrophota bacterium]
MKEHHDNLKKQFSIRVDTFEKAANWMLDPSLLEAHLRAAGEPSEGSDKCLDLCCGTGIVGRALKQKGWQPTGIDVTREMAERCSDFFPAVTGSIESMPFEDASFDLAVLRQSFMLVDEKAALSEIRRVLKKNGVFILSQSVPFSRRDNEHYRKVQIKRHINILRYYTADDLIAECEKHGFRTTGTEYLRVRESVNHWLDSAPELSENIREEILSLISGAPENYLSERNVEISGGKVFEDWNWAVMKFRAE